MASRSGIAANRHYCREQTRRSPFQQLAVVPVNTALKSIRNENSGSDRWWTSWPNGS